MDRPSRDFNLAPSFPDQYRDGRVQVIHEPPSTVGQSSPSQSHLPLARPPQLPLHNPMQFKAPRKRPLEDTAEKVPHPSTVDKSVLTLETALASPEKQKKTRKRRKKKKKLVCPNYSAHHSLPEEEDEDTDSSDASVETSHEAKVHDLSYSFEEDAFLDDSVDESINENAHVEPFLPLEIPPDLPRPEIDLRDEALNANSDSQFLTPSDVNGEDVIGCRVCHGTFFDRWEELVHHLQSPEHLARQEANVMVMRAIADQILSLQPPETELSNEAE